MSLRPGVVIIAEAGVNHNGDIGRAHQLVDLATNAGANIVKFQTFDPSAVVSETGKTAEYQRRATGSTGQHAMLQALALPAEAWQELADHCRDSGVEFLSTAFDWPSLEHLLTIGLERIKVPSGEIDNLRFIRRAAGLGLPLIISTGMSDWVDVDRAVEAAVEAPSITLLHCVSSYPAPAASTNLAVIPAMRERYSLPVGWSDHTIGERSAVAATALGATVVEKHITVDKSLPGPDHAASAEPGEFGAYVAAIRECELMLGSREKQRTMYEEDVAVAARRSHHATRDMVVGTVLQESDTVLLRPATGAPASWNLAGRRLAVSVREGEPIEVGDLEDTSLGRERRRAVPPPGTSHAMPDRLTY